MPPAFVDQGKVILRALALRWLPWLDRYRVARQFVKFCLVGLSNVVVYFTIYLLLTRGFRWYFLAAGIVSFVVAVSWSFYWNRRWTFRIAGGPSVHHYRKFVATNVISGVISNGTLYVLVERFGWNDLAANAVIIGFTSAWNFTVTKFWAFRR